MWVYPDIVESQQWMTITHRKSKEKARASSSNVMGIFTRETEEDVASLTSSGEESVLAADTGTPFTSKTQSGKQYLKQYDQLVAISSQPGKETTEQSTKQPMDKQKELRYAKALQKDDTRLLTPFRFDILAQLANIPARSLYTSFSDFPNPLGKL